MEELRRVEFLPHDQGLRDDVRRLGSLVGELLVEQEGEVFFEHVESIRRTAIQRRESEAPLDDLAAQLADLDPDQALVLTRAFSTYFQVVNLAERVHRIRRHRDYQRAGAGPQPDGLEAVLTTLKAEGMDHDFVNAWLQRLDVEPVFTAHPTEAVRRSLLEKEQVMTRCLIDGFDISRTPDEQANDEARLRMA